MSFDIVSELYLSAVTPLGFVSRTASLCGEGRKRVFLLKGGTAAMRSRLVLDAAEAAQKAGRKVSAVRSALDERQLEASFWDSAAVIDSSEPYRIEPKLPSAFEDVVWTGGCFDGRLREARAELEELSEQGDIAFEQSRKLLFAADELLKDNARTALYCADTEKVIRQAKSKAKKLLRPSQNGGIRQYISRGQFSDRSVSLPDGCALTLLQDINGGCARLYLKTLLEQARAIGCAADVFFSPNAPFSVIDVLCFRESGCCFAVESRRLRFDVPADSIINARRFTDKARLSVHSDRMAQNRKAANQLYLRAAQYFEQFSSFRQKKEEIYNYFLDTAKFDKLRHTLSDNIFTDASAGQL